MISERPLCIVRGGGDLATGAILRLHRAGFPVLVAELAQPRVVRRLASAAEAIYAGEHDIEGLHAVHAGSRAEAARALERGQVPVLVDPDAASIAEFEPDVVVDARMLKRRMNRPRAFAGLLIGLGPGFIAGDNCDAVVETMRGHNLGRVYWQGQAAPDTGVPETVKGYNVERVLRAPAAGTVAAVAEIGMSLRAGDLIARVGDAPLTAAFDGVLRGLIHAGTQVAAAEKIGDLDPRNAPEYCSTVSDKSLAVGGGVLEALLTWLHNRT